MTIRIALDLPATATDLVAYAELVADISPDMAIEVAASEALAAVALVATVRATPDHPQVASTPPTPAGPAASGSTSSSTRRTSSTARAPAVAPPPATRTTAWAATYTTVADRLWLMRTMLTEAARVVAPKGTVLYKCQDQVVSGRVVWQTRLMADHGEANGLRLVDALHLPSYRAQPPGRRQVHARRNYSTLLVFRKAR